MCLDTAIDFAYRQLSVFIAEAQEFLGSNLLFCSIHHEDAVVAANP